MAAMPASTVALMSGVNVGVSAGIAADTAACTVASRSGACVGVAGGADRGLCPMQATVATNAMANARIPSNLKD